MDLTYCGVVTPYTDIDLDQLWRHQTITWANFHLSLMVICGIDMGAVSQKMLNKSIHKMSLKFSLVKSFPNPSGAYQLAPHEPYPHKFYGLKFDRAISQWDVWR